jgi:hypothetical protein
VTFGFAREYIRTCGECGYSWRVPRAIAHQSGRGMTAITARNNMGSPVRRADNGIVPGTGGLSPPR